MKPARRILLFLITLIILKGLWAPPAVAMGHEALMRPAHAHAAAMAGHSCLDKTPAGQPADKDFKCQLQCEAALSPCLLASPVVFHDFERPALRTVYRSLELGMASQPDRPPPNI